jgi:hypothetical protein
MTLPAQDLKHPHMRNPRLLGDGPERFSRLLSLPDRLTPLLLGTRTTRRSASHTGQGQHLGEVAEHLDVRANHHRGAERAVAVRPSGAEGGLAVPRQPCALGVAQRANVGLKGRRVSSHAVNLAYQWAVVK